MSINIPFGALSRQHSIIAMRLENGAQVEGSRGTLVADLSGRETRFLAASGMTCFIPQAGEWYAISTALYPYTFTVERWLPYYDSVFVNQTFRLGFSCGFSARVAHLAGLWQWISRRDRVTSADMAQLMSDMIRDTLHTAIQDMSFPEKPAYEDYLQSQAELERVSEAALFHAIYPNGLCLSPGSLRITGFTKKYFELLQ